jgi:hypothetical protein
MVQGGGVKRKKKERAWDKEVGWGRNAKCPHHMDSIFIPNPSKQALMRRFLI